MSDKKQNDHLESYSRRLFAQRTSLMAVLVALGGGSYLLQPKGAWAADPIKIGIASAIYFFKACGGDSIHLK